MHPDAVFGAKRDGREFGDGERGGVARKNRAGPGELIEDRENLQFQLPFLPATASISRSASRHTSSTEREVVRFGQRRFLLFWRHFSARDAIVERLPDIGEALLEHLRRDVLENSSISANRRGIGNAASHRAGADHADRFYVHEFTSMISCA